MGQNKPPNWARSEYRNQQVFIKNHGFTVNMTEQSGTTIEKRGADTEATLALVTTLRFFVQERDGISFVQMGKLYEALPVSDQDKEQVRQGVAAIEGYMDRPMILSLGDERLTNRKLFELFMYGSLAHAHPDKAAMFEKWIGQPPFRPIAEAMFERIVAELIKCADWLYGVNERALQQL